MTRLPACCDDSYLTASTISRPAAMAGRIGWFDAFRDHGAPTSYGDNRMPVVLDTQIAALLAVLALPLLAFLLVLPGRRQLKFISTLTFGLSMLQGAALLVCIYHPCWHEARVRIFASYRAFSADRMGAELGVRIGLKHVNMTLSSGPPPRQLRGHSTPTSSMVADLNYNERFEFGDASWMESELQRALRKGLPFPLLKIVEYLSVDGFHWGRQYRLAGYYASILLWLAFACWLMQMLLLCVVPRHFCRAVLVTGCCTLVADLVYAVNIPRLMHIYFPGPDSSLSVLRFHLSTCFYVTLLAGVFSVGFGGILYVLETRHRYRLSTFLCEDNEHRYSSSSKCHNQGHMFQLEEGSPSSGFSSRSSSAVGSLSSCS